MTIATVLALLLAAGAQDTTAAPPAPARAPVAATPEAAAVATTLSAKPKLICEDQVPIGSRLATRKVCMTREQWAQERRGNSGELDRIQRGWKSD